MPEFAKPTSFATMPGSGFASASAAAELSGTRQVAEISNLLTSGWSDREGPEAAIGATA